MFFCWLSYYPGTRVHGQRMARFWKSAITNHPTTPSEYHIIFSPLNVHSVSLCVEYLYRHHVAHNKHSNRDRPGSRPKTNKHILESRWNWCDDVCLFGSILLMCALRPRHCVVFTFLMFLWQHPLSPPNPPSRRPHRGNHRYYIIWSSKLTL